MIEQLPDGGVVGGAGGVLVQTTLQPLGYEVDLVSLAAAEIPIAIIALVVASIVFIQKDKRMVKKYYGSQAAKKEEK